MIIFLGDFFMDYNKYMKIAYSQAKKALKIDEVPIGCVIVWEDEEGEKILARGYNRRVKDKNVLKHAEIIAINRACKKIGDWRLDKAVMFVTIEPCPMCAGALLQTRIKKVVFGARNPKAGCVGSIYNLLDEDRFNHKAEILEGVMEKECASLMTEFFREFRNRKVKKSDG